MILFLAVSAALAGKWDDKDADVVATTALARPAEAVHAVLSDPTKLMALYPSACATWKTPIAGAVPGATGVVTYRAAGMRRKLNVVVKEVSPSHIDLEHTGPKGFTTRFALDPSETGTAVTMTNYLTVPPMVAGYYFKRVQPAWVACHEQVLANLNTVLPPQD